MEVKTYTQTLEFLRSYIEPVASTAEKAISEALGFVLAEDLHSPLVPPLTYLLRTYVRTDGTVRFGSVTVTVRNVRTVRNR